MTTNINNTSTTFFTFVVVVVVVISAAFNILQASTLNSWTAYNELQSCKYKLILPPPLQILSMTFVHRFLNTSDFSSTPPSKRTIFLNLCHRLHRAQRSFLDHASTFTTGPTDIGYCDLLQA